MFNNQEEIRYNLVEMPHFEIDCSEQILELKSPEIIILKIYDNARSTDLFIPEEIKVRINPFQYYSTGNTNDNSIHIFANIMGGRSSEQKSYLSKIIASYLKSMFPEVSILYPE